MPDSPPGQDFLCSVRMELYEIEGFLAVADQLHFGRAAEQLRVSSGRVTQTIQQLERRIGAQLFDRTTRRVALTPIGRQLLTELRPGYDQIQRAVRHATLAGRGYDGTLTIGFLGAPAAHLAYATAERFRSAHPRTDLDIREVHWSDGLEAWLPANRDLLLLPGPLLDPTLTSGPTLITERRMLALSTAHPLAARDALSLEDLAEVTLLRPPEAWPAALSADRTPGTTPSGRAIAHGRRADSLEELLALTGAGTGTFVIGEQTARYHQRPCVTYLPLVAAPPIRSALIWRKSKETARIRAFNDTALSLGSRDAEVAQRFCAEKPFPAAPVQ